MPFQRRIPPPTKAQQARQDRARELGCIHCWMEDLIEFNDEGDAYSPAGWFQIHHQTEDGFTQSQDDSVCSCSWHHQGICRPGMTSRDMLNEYGPSLAKGTVPFFERYGRNAEQLEFQNALIAKRDECERAA